MRLLVDLAQELLLLVALCTYLLQQGLLLRGLLVQSSQLCPLVSCLLVQSCRGGQHSPALVFCCLHNLPALSLCCLQDLIALCPPLQLLSRLFLLHLCIHCLLQLPALRLNLL